MLSSSANGALGNSTRVPGVGAHPDYDASLLFCRMARLHIDRNRLATDDPLLFRELQGRCTLCLSKRQCIHELASDLFGNRPDYCPNAGTLNLLEALECCLGKELDPVVPA